MCLFCRFKKLRRLNILFFLIFFVSKIPCFPRETVKKANVVFLNSARTRSQCHIESVCKPSGVRALMFLTRGTCVQTPSGTRYFSKAICFINFLM